MTRISDSASHNALIRNMLRTQTSLLETNLQVSTGKEAQLYSGIANRSERLVNVENSRALLDRYVSNNKTSELRLNLAFTAVEAAQTTTSEFKTALSNFQSTDSYTKDDVERIQEWAYNAMIDMEAYLNAQADGRYLFGGSRENTAPIDLSLTSLDDFKTTYDGASKSYATTRDAHLSDLTVNKDANGDHKTSVTSSNWMIFRQDDDGTASTSGSGTIEATSALFSSYKAGSQITIADTASNNGTYTIESINSDGTKITVKTEMLTDETTPIAVVAEAAAATAVFTLPDGSTLNNAATGNVDFTAPDTIDVTTNASIAGISAGDVITLSGTTSNNKSFTVTSVDTGTGVIKVSENDATAFALANGTSIDDATTGAVTFDRSANTITATNASFSDVTAGEVITVSGSTANNGTYTVSSVSADNKTVTVEATKLTDEGLNTGDTYFNYTVGSQTFVDISSRTIAAQDYTGASLTGTYSDLQVGDSVVIAGTAGHDNTYTIETVASDGSSFTVEATPAMGGADETDVNGTTVTVSNRSFIFSTGTELVLTDGASDTIVVQRQGGGVDTKLLEGLRAGMYITLDGAPTPANDKAYLIKTVDAATGTITVDDTVTPIDTSETYTPVSPATGSLKVFAADGSITTSSYFNGDQRSRTFRVDDTRTYEMDITAADPAFEKAIRAMGIIAQGDWGTEGGLDQNKARVTDALYLLNDALDNPAEGTAPYGTEETSDLDTITFRLGLKQNLLADAAKIHNETIARLDGWIADIENADPLQAITKLLNEQRSLETSYQSLSRVLNLSLTNYL